MFDPCRYATTDHLVPRAARVAALPAPPPSNSIRTWLVLFGATRDLARRRLMPGLNSPSSVGADAGNPGDDMDTDRFHPFAKQAVTEFSSLPLDIENQA